MKRKAIAVLVIVGLLAFAQTLSAQEKGKEKKKPTGTFGRVKSVDTSGSSITVTTGRKGETSDKTYKVAKDCKVTIGEETKALGDLKEGTLVSLTLGANDEVTEIKTIMRKKKQAS